VVVWSYRCRLFACGPADATAIPKVHNLWPHFNPDWLYFSVSGLSRLPRENRPLTGAVVVVVYYKQIRVTLEVRGGCFTCNFIPNAGHEETFRHGTSTVASVVNLDRPSPIITRRAITLSVHTSVQHIRRGTAHGAVRDS